MVPSILILILVALIGINVQFKEQLRLMKATKNDIYDVLLRIERLLTPQDFSREDRAVKAMTERENRSAKEVAEAIAELPPQPTGKP
jgi:hypothetical protein